MQRGGFIAVRFGSVSSEYIDASTNDAVMMMMRNVPRKMDLIMLCEHELICMSMYCAWCVVYFPTVVER